MQNAIYKRYLDYVPFIILSVAAVYLLITTAQNGIVLRMQHYAGLVFLFVVAAFFILKKHQFAMLVLGLTLIAGYIGFVNYSPVLRTFSFSLTQGGIMIPLCNGQPLVIICLLLHFILSGRYYVGILTRKYWVTLKRNSLAGSNS